jgi:hypothetical protein
MKMILTHESGSQEDQFDEKNGGKKISCYYPFKLTVAVFLFPLTAFLWQR